MFKFLLKKNYYFEWFNIKINNQHNYFLIFNLLKNIIIYYPTPIYINYLWNFGIFALFAIVHQLITGIFLAMFYIPHITMAFDSVEYIMRDISFGWILRYLHANGASLFFFVVYIHIFRGLYFGSYKYPRQLLWCSGVIILLIMILTAFLGYVLPWGQMSFWAATVITNLASVVPFCGKDIVIWLWGGFSVDNATLVRFFSLHYLFGILLFTLIIIHILLLHLNGSNTPLGINNLLDKVPFTPYFTVKDLFSVVSIYCLIYLYFVFFFPNYLGHPDNYIEANPLVTPAHIVPEWYFLPFYAILRSVPDKSLGVFLLVFSIIVLMLLPFLDFFYFDIRTSRFKLIFKSLFWIFIINVITLGWVGGKPIESPFYEIGFFCTNFYFIYILILIPMCSYLELFLLGFFDFKNRMIVTNR